MEQSAVCGVGESLQTASNAALERLLDQFGRNGSLSDEQTEKKAQIEAILQSRQSGCAS